MRVFVAGGAGYIGSVCVEELLNHDYETIVYDNLSEGHRSAVDPRATFIEGDLSDPDRLMESLEKYECEVIIHFAAHALVGESMENPGKYFRNNVSNGLNLLDAAVECGIRKVVFSSTCATFGIPERVPMNETLLQNPVNPYGESKKMFEKILEWYHQIHRLNFTAFRYFNAAGAGDQFGEHHRVETHLIPNVLKVALKHSDHCKIFGTDYDTHDGTCIRDYIHVRDLAQAHILGMDSDHSGFYNLGNGEGYSVRQVIDTCRRVTGCGIEVLEEPRRSGDPSRLVADSSKAKRELGWAPQFPDLESIVRSAWDWHSRFPNGYSD
ncbi:MAG TPA: UDP-glucose 4-epimerase GalE [Verrucomicrobiales bacterium]|nr:UDP-glucose 4-epimerase GalE [Verrucomicrobiales bacterium]HIL68861.1 UDP-glucose 4-epimerase GalE [Verrucomicrobiota bacterium]